MNIVTYIHEQCQRAKTCAEDGELHAAAELLDEAAVEVRVLAVAADRFIAAMADDDEVINPYGSGPVPIEPREG